MTSPSDKLKETENVLSILSTNIVYNIQQFDKTLSLDAKKKIIDELERLILKYDTLNKKQKEEFYISNTKSEYKKCLQQNTKNYKEFYDHFTQRKNIYQILSMRNNSFIAPQLSIDLGEVNKHSLDYSKIKTVLQDAKSTYETTKKYIEELENDIKGKPLIAPDDPAYQSYLSYMKAKKEMIIKQKRNYFKYAILILVGLVILIGLLYIIIFHIGGGEDLLIDEIDM